ncbi:MAG TPA: hypothetical protein DDZ81_24555 [Acetobacteraceae bacterium]|jgi:outer membrane protein|nr:hypothetical protein [Acetobacteraceae bacterium]
MARKHTYLYAIAGVAALLGAAGPPPADPAAAAPARQAAAARSLLDLYAEAQSGNPAIKAAEAGVSAADHGMDDAFFGFMPRASLVVSPQREFQNVISTDNPVYQVGKKYFGNFGYTFQVLQPVIDPGALARAQGADAEYRGQSQQLIATKQKTTYELIEAYLLALASLDSERLAIAEEETYAGHRDEISRRLVHGLASRTDLADIQARIDRARSSRILSRADVTKAMAVLRRIAGRPVTALLPLADRIPVGAPVPPDPDAWVESANQTNPELKAMVAQTDVADAEFKRLLAETLPRMDIILSDARLNAGGSLYGGAAKTDEQIAELRITVPLFNADGRGYPALAANERRNQIRYQTEDRTREIEQRVRAAFADAQRDSESAALLQSAAANHALVRDDLSRKFTAGVAAISDMIDAERDYVRAEREALATNYNYLIAMMQLKRLTGTIGEGDVRYISGLLDTKHAYVAITKASGAR